MAGRMKMELPPWHERSVEGSITFNKTPLFNEISGKLYGLVERVRLDDLWQSLQKYKVVSSAGAGAIRLKRSPEERVGYLLERLQSEPCTKFHGFLKALSEDGQSHVIMYLGLDPATYTDKVVGNMQSGGRSAHHIWDERHPGGQTMLRDTHLFKRNVTDNFDNFVQSVRLENLWPKFRRLKVLSTINEDRVRAEKASLDKAYKLMEILETSHSWRFHAFLKALCEDDQGPCIMLLGLDVSTYM